VSRVFSLSLRGFLFFLFSQAASVATLPSALVVERFSLGASWVFSFQQVLLPDLLPLPRSYEGSLGEELIALT